MRGLPDDADAASALTGFQRFPAWMWRNTEVRDFVEWLRGYNTGRGPERQSHYFFTHLAGQFDAVIQIDGTNALEPLDKGPVWSTGEAPETFPSGM